LILWSYETYSKSGPFSPAQDQALQDWFNEIPKFALKKRKNLLNMILNYDHFLQMKRGNITMYIEDLFLE
jgi:hypothetical protein